MNTSSRQSSSVIGIGRAPVAIARSSDQPIGTTVRPAVGVRTTLVYGAGEIPNAIKTIAFGLFTLYFYTTVVGLPGTLVGIAAAVGLLWDAAIDPYIGYVSDRARFRFGRRHTFMLAGALTMGASFWAFFNPPSALSNVGLFAWLLVTSLVVRTATSVHGIPYFALGAELSSDYQERTFITGVRGAMALVGTLVAASLSFVVFFPPDVAGGDPKLNPAGYAQMGLAFGAVMTLLGLAVTFQTRPWPDPPPEPVSGRRPPQAASSFVRSFTGSLANPSFRALLGSYSLFFLAMVINSTLSIHYVTYYLEIPQSTAISTFQLVFYIAALGGVLIWLRASSAVEKHWLYLLGLTGVTAVLLAAVFLVGEGRYFGVGHFRAVLVGHALGGFFGSVLWFVPGSMIADVADEDAVATGQRREGSFFGLFYFGQQIAAGGALLAGGVLLEWFAGLGAGQTDPSALTIQRIGLLYGGLPAALVLLAGVCMLRYSLTRARLVEIQSELTRRRAAADRKEGVS